MADADVAAIVARAVELRHELHRVPELAFAEERSAALVRGELDRLGLPWRPCAGTGTVAVLGPADAPRGIGVRAELDALEVPEASGATWASEQPGLSHACGHDGHVATLLALAGWAAARRGALRARLHLVFQPGEEGAGGARRMLEDDALDGIDELYAWHNWPDLPAGTAVCPDGCLMGANGELRIAITGVGGHAAQPARCRNPVTAGAAFAAGLPEALAAATTADGAEVLGISTFHAGTRENVIPDRAELSGTVRAPSAMRCRELAGVAEAHLTAVCAAAGVAGELTYLPHYDATVNAPACAGRLRRAWTATDPGGELRILPAPLAVSEDFGFYLAEVPGAMLLAGTDREAALHTPAYDFDDALIGRMLPVLTSLLADLGLC